MGCVRVLTLGIALVLSLALSAYPHGALADLGHWSETVVVVIPPGDDVDSRSSSWVYHPLPEDYMYISNTAFRNGDYMGYAWDENDDTWHIWAVVLVYDPAGTQYFQGFGSHYYSDIGWGSSYGELYH